MTPKIGQRVVCIGKRNFGMTGYIQHRGPQRHVVDASGQVAIGSSPTGFSVSGYWVFASVADIYAPDEAKVALTND